MNKKVLTIIMSIFLVIITLGTISVIEFYYAKERDRMPIMAIRSENIAKQYEKHASIFYNVYECYSKDTFVLTKNAKEPVCNRVIKFFDDYYTNINNFKIGKKDYQMIYDTSKTLQELEAFTKAEEVENAIIVAEEYQRSLHVPLKTIIINKEIVNVEAKKELVTTNEYGDYSWQFQRTNQNYYICIKDGLYKEYKDGECLGEWKEFKMSDKWCSLAKDSTMTNIINTYKKYCK